MKNSNNNIFSELKFCTLFSNFTNEELNFTLKSFFNILSLKHYLSNDIIFNEDEDCIHLSIILKGEVHIEKNDSLGNVLIINTLKKGDVFGENLLFGDMNKYPVSIICSKDCSLLHLPKNSIINLCQNNNIFLLELLKILSNKAVSLNLKLKQISMKTIRQKICNFLIDNNNNLGVIKIGMTKKELAQKFCVQRPSLSRELIKMKKENLIDYDNEKIYILDIESIKSQV